MPKREKALVHRELKKKGVGKFVCRYCSFSTREYKELCNHRLKIHFCDKCQCKCTNVDTHNCKQHKQYSPLPPVDIKDTVFVEKGRANGGALVTLCHMYKSKFVEIRAALESVYGDLYNLLDSFVSKYKGIRTKLNFKLDVVDLKTELHSKRYYHSALTRLTHPSFIDEVVLANLQYVENTIEMLSKTGSGLRVEGVIALECDVMAYQPVRPRGHIPLPAGLRKRRGIINIKCKTDCFRLCILSALYGHWIKLKKYPHLTATELPKSKRRFLKGKKESPSNYRHIIKMVEQNKLLDFKGFEYSFDINKLPQWEEKNNVGVVLYEYDPETKNVKACKYTDKVYSRVVHLLLLRNEDNFHLCLLSDVSKFFGIPGRKRAQICPHCGLRYNAESHVGKCGFVNQPGLKTVKDSRRFFKFHDLHKLLPPPFRIYTSLLYFKDGAEKSTSSPFGVAGFGVVVINSSGEISHSKFHIGGSAMQIYLDYVLDLADELQKKIRADQLPIPEMTTEEKEVFDKSETCEICQTTFTADNPKTRHHSHHIPGFPITCCCQKCNLGIKPRTYIQMFSHSHFKIGNQLIIQKLASRPKMRIRITPRTTENFIAVTLNNKLRLVDSRKILDLPLQTLVKRLLDSGSTKTFEPFYSEIQKEALFQPSFFPHTWFDSTEKLKERQLPPKDQFVDLFMDKEISDDEYQQTVNLYKYIGCKTFNDYCMISLKSQVFQLAACMEEFGDWAFKTYKLSPLNDLTLASYAYSVATFHAKSDFEIPTDKKLIQFVLDNIKGGVSLMTKRVVTANSERLGHENVKDDERVEILMADCNSLYHYCLSQSLPYKDYRFLDEIELNQIDIINLNENSGFGWIFCVTLAYPREIKHESRDYPFCATKENLNWSFLSHSQSDLKDACLPSMQNEFGNHVLMLTQLEKKRQGIYYKLLKFFLRQGMRIQEMHFAVQFREKPYLKNFMEMNLNVRKTCGNAFHESISKQISNMLFGKMLSINKSLNVKVITSQQQAIKEFSRHNFVDAKVVNTDVSLAYFQKANSLVDKNLFAPLVVLDLAKLRMYELIYNVLKPKFGERMYIVSSLTDSLVCEIKDTNKTYLQDLKDISYAFDFSTLPFDHPLFDSSNEKTPGLLKIEYPYPLQFVAVKSKVYSVLNKCQKCRIDECVSLECENCLANSVSNGCSRRKKTSHQVYLKAALEQHTEPTEFFTLKSDKQQVSLVSTKKNIFSIKDQHRFWVDFNTSIPFGYEEPLDNDTNK